MDENSVQNFGYLLNFLAESLKKKIEYLLTSVVNTSQSTQLTMKKTDIWSKISLLNPAARDHGRS